MPELRQPRRRRHRRGFRPPHCPNRWCRFYTPAPGWPVVRDGLYCRPSDGRSFQRYRCLHCGRRFSTRTFAADYWLRLRKLLAPIAHFACEGPALRQAARLLGVSHSTVGRHLSRAGRQCLLAHAQMVQGRPIREPVVVDGFETFEHSQFFPFHLNFAVGARSWMIHGFTDSPLRRKGRMTPGQKSRRAQLEARFGRPDPQAVETGMTDLLRAVLPASENRPVVLHSDDHPAYRRALGRLRREPGIPPVEHRITSSLERRTSSNPLFPVNLTDLLARHGQAAHRRETIAFCKRRQGAIERAAIFTLWRNAIKWRREKEPGTTAAMAAGVLTARWSWAEVFRRRRFPRRHLLAGPWWSYYWRRIKTLPLGEAQTEHRLKYAF